MPAHKKTQSAGFSMIELAIGLTVAGLVTAATIQAYESFTKSRPLKETIANQAAVRVALERFLATQKKLPCPAQQNLPPDAPNAGTEQCASTQVGAIHIGEVPYAALGIEIKTSYDGWGRKLQYAVTGVLTDVGTYNPMSGGIIVNGTPGDPTAHVLVLSQGKTGAGAYTPEGKIYAPCGTAATGLDFENCNGDNIFTNAPRSLVLGLDRFESVILPVFKIAMESDRWSLTRSNASTSAAANSALGNTGIGTKIPTEKLDVVGNIQTSANVHAGKFANTGGANFFEPRIIGGTGLECAGAMAGIRLNDKVCADNNITLTTPGLTGTCPVGYVTGIDPLGVVTCSSGPPPLICLPSNCLCSPGYNISN